jgi:hypothetical protein
MRSAKLRPRGTAPRAPRRPGTTSCSARCPGRRPAQEATERAAEGARASRPPRRCPLAPTSGVRQLDEQRRREGDCAQQYRTRVEKAARGPPPRSRPSPDRAAPVGEIPPTCARSTPRSPLGPPRPASSCAWCRCWRSPHTRATAAARWSTRRRHRGSAGAAEPVATRHRPDRSGLHRPRAGPPQRRPTPAPPASSPPRPGSRPHPLGPYSVCSAPAPTSVRSARSRSSGSSGYGCCWWRWSVARRWPPRCSGRC